ncbi:MAG TPA: hypothetical protein VG125_09690 [Pirellulales bacterium]|jgi:hypothetical protein|nr:hypothetical protein [Pirellulales bacterium]
MRKFCFLAVAAAALALLGADQAKAGGRRTRYYSYGGTTVTQRATSQAAQSTATRRYSYAPAGAYAPANRPFTMGSAPFDSNYFRADRKIRGY